MNVGELDMAPGRRALTNTPPVLVSSVTLVGLVLLKLPALPRGPVRGIVYSIARIRVAHYALTQRSHRALTNAAALPVLTIPTLASDSIAPNHPDEPMTINRHVQRLSFAKATMPLPKRMALELQNSKSKIVAYQDTQSLRQEAAE